MKIRHLYRLSRLWTPCAAIILGVLAGYFVGYESILHAAKFRLSEYAGRVGERNEELGTEIIKVLFQSDASNYTPCSDQDISLLRRLTFSARFLKDVGRLRNNTLLCSATLGRLSTPPTMLKPNLVFRSGFHVFIDYPLQSPADARAVVISTQTSDVVLSPDIYDEFSQSPIHFAVGMRSPSSISAPAIANPTQFDNPEKQPEAKVLSGPFGMIAFPSAVFDSREAVLIGDTVYCSRCTSRYSVCAVTSIRKSEIWKNNEILLLGYTCSGGIAGILCATALLSEGRRRRSPAKQLRRALRVGKLTVAYQPIVEMGSHRIVGAEALARWVDEDGERVRPERIIALAESEGFSSEVTRFVLTRSVEEIAPLLEIVPTFRLNINLAPSDIGDPNLLFILDEKLGSSLISPKNIAFELSERATADRPVSVETIRMLREKGHEIYIDDFGTGYSNLAYLTELNVNGIKISRAFTATIGTESITASIVPQILGVAKALNLNVVVQGIEREEQAIFFASDDPAILGQGWFFGLPVPFKDLMQKCTEIVD